MTMTARTRAIAIGGIMAVAYGLLIYRVGAGVTACAERLIGD